MANTLVGVYDKFSQAQGAYDELISCGFDRGDLQLSPSDESSDARQTALSTAGTSAERTDESFGSGIRNFFHNLFSGNDEYREHADVYAEAVRRGHYLVTVHADSDEERVQATQVMNRFGPVDIDERAEQWKSRGWSTYDETAPAMSETEIQDEHRYYATAPSTMSTGTGAMAAGMAGASATSATAGSSAYSDATIADTSRADTSAAEAYRTDTTASDTLRSDTASRDTTFSGDRMRSDLSSDETTRADLDMTTDTSRSDTGPIRTDSAALSDEPATTRMSATAADIPERDTGMARAVPESTTIPVIQEELQVGKRQVQRGGVRVYQHIRETPVDQSVRLHEEHVHVERHPVDRPASEADLSGLKESSFEIRETAEEAVIGKTARIVEEVVVSKEASERTQEIHDKVRRTDVEVEELGMSARDSTSLSGDEDFRRHFQTTYGGTSSDRFEDYEPAYRYGSTVASDERFRGHKWEESEEDVHADWDSRYGSATPWEKAKNAVRYGWERVTR